MKQWDGEIYKNRHIALMKWHYGFAIFYVFLAWLLLENSKNDQFNSTLIFSSLPVVLHLLLAYGSKQKYELSRRFSEWVGFFLILNFPIGTFLSLWYFLPNTTWIAPETKP